MFTSTGWISMLSVTLGSVVYNSVYGATLYISHAFVFYLATVLSLAPLTLSVYVFPSSVAGEFQLRPRPYLEQRSKLSIAKKYWGKNEEKYNIWNFDWVSDEHYNNYEVLRSYPSVLLCYPSYIVCRVLFIGLRKRRNHLTMTIDATSVYTLSSGDESKKGILYLTRFWS